MVFGSSQTRGSNININEINVLEDFGDLISSHLISPILSVIVKLNHAMQVSNTNVVHASTESQRSQYVLEMASPTVRGWV